MKETKITQQLAEQWQDATERAEAQAARTQELDAENLDAAAGLAVKARIRSGKSPIEGCGLTIQY